MFAYEAKAACGVTVTVTVARDWAGTVTESAEKTRSIPVPVQSVELNVKEFPSMVGERAWPPRVYVWAVSETLVSCTWKVHPSVPSPRSALGRDGVAAPTTVGYTDEVVAATASTMPAPTLRGE